MWPPIELRDAVHARRSTADLGSGRLTAADVSLVLAAAAGITGEIEGPAGTPIAGRAAPSGGGLFPLDLFVLPLRCDGIAAGICRYDPERHALEELPAPPSPIDLGSELAGIVYQQEIATTAALVVVLAATFARSRVKYGLRAYRHVLLEAGHVAQGGLVAAAAAGLRSVPIGGFVDRRLERLLGLDGVRETVVHAFAVGRAAE